MSSRTEGGGSATTAVITHDGSNGQRSEIAFDVGTRMVFERQVSLVDIPLGPTQGTGDTSTGPDAPSVAAPVVVPAGTVMGESRYLESGVVDEVGQRP